MNWRPFLERCHTHYARWSEKVLDWRYLLGIFLIAFALTALRRPDALLYPQFWAEDGTVWFMDAYRYGVRSLFLPHTGYFQTLPRLVALLAQAVPLHLAPLLFNCAAIGVKILPVVFIFSARCRRLIPSLGAKVLLGALYIYLPNTSEILANITNGHWYAALLMFLLLIADPARSRWGKCLDGLVLFVAGLSGPFGVFLLPVLFTNAFAKREKGFWKRMAPVLAAAAIQIIALSLTAFSTRSSMTLGASPALFVKVISGQVFMGMLLGKDGFAWLYNQFLHAPTLISWLLYFGAFFVGSVVIAYAAIKSRWELKLFLLFCSVVTFFSLVKPMASVKAAQWSVMLLPGNATRYWFFPMLGFMVSIIFLLGERSKWPRLLAASLLVIMLIGIRSEARFEPWPDRQFVEQAKIFEAAPVGTVQAFRIMPENWGAVRLEKR